MSDYVRVSTSSDLPPGTMKSFTVKDKDILVANVEGKYFALGSLCTHVGGPLVEGKLNDHIVTCPWHGSQFDLRTGAVVRFPARLPEPKYDVKVEGNDILVKV